MKRKYTLLQMDNSAEIQAIKVAMKQAKEIRMYLRYRVIYLHFKGNTNKEIAIEENLCNHTVGTYIKNYRKHGLEGLKMKHSSGAPRLLNPEQEQDLVKVITTKTPDQVGFPNRKNWYINIVQQWVKDTWGVQYSHRGMAEVLYRLNLSFTRPAYTLAKADPEKQEEFKNNFELLKKPSRRKN
jgi:putative transposase